MRHELKIWPQFYVRVIQGLKTFEVRENDRGYQMGDVVNLREWDPDECKFTGNQKEFMVGFVLPIGDNRVVFSLLDSAGRAHKAPISYCLVDG